MFKITLYQTETGKCPVNEFLDSLDAQSVAKIAKAVNALARLGTQMRFPDSRPLVDKLFELRIQERSNAHRVIYFFVEGNEIIMTNGFSKKSQKTPVSEIERAKRYRKDYYDRKK